VPLPIEPKPFAADLRPAAVFRPTSATDAADGLRALQAAGIPTRIAGGQSKWRGGAFEGTLLSSSGLRGILSISADDLYTTALAGTALTELQAQLAERGFRVPLGNPWPTATVGGAIAANTNGPLRALHGGVRDTVLAVQVALPDGRLLRFGRTLVKDVAGYEMRKLFVGSYGTLGLLTEVSLRVVPLPLGRRTLLVSAPNLAQGVVWALAAWRQATCCCGLVLLPRPMATVPQHPEGGPTARVLASECTLAFTAEGHPADVAAQIELTRNILQSAGAGQPVETDLDATGLWEHVLADGAFVVRAAVAPRDLAALLADTKLNSPVAVCSGCSGHTVRCRQRCSPGPAAGILVHVAGSGGQAGRLRTADGRAAHVAARSGVQVT
jgi:D-lactate dehydrogenase (cytochrome)